MFQLNLILVLKERVLFQERNYLIQIPLISRLWILLKNSDSIIEYLLLRKNLFSLLRSNLTLFSIHRWLFLLFHNMVKHITKSFDFGAVLIFFWVLNLLGCIFWECRATLVRGKLCRGDTARDFIQFTTRGLIFRDIGSRWQSEGDILVWVALHVYLILLWSHFLICLNNIISDLNERLMYIWIELNIRAI